MICLIVENPVQTQDQAQQVMTHLRSTGPIPPEGARLVLGGAVNRGNLTISVWDSQEALDTFFAERLAPAYAEAGLSFDGVERTLFEPHTFEVAAKPQLSGTDTGPDRA